MSVGVRNIGRQASPVDMFVLYGSPTVVRDCVVGEVLNLREARIRRIEWNIVKGSVSITAVERSADILIQMVVGDEEVITVVAGVGNNQGIAWGELAL